MSTKEDALFALDASEVRAGQRWKHTKKGTTYTIVATAINEATMAPSVVYTGHDGVVWVQALDVFLSNNDEGKPRFILLTDDTEAQTAPFERDPGRRCCLASGFPPYDHSLDCALRSTMREVRA